MYQLLAKEKSIMKGKLYIVSAPRFIFDGLTPDRQERIVYLPDFLSFPKTRFKQLTRALLVGRIHLSLIHI